MYLDAQELNSKLLDYAASVSAASISVATPSLSTLGLELGMETRSLAKDLKQATAEAHNIVERHPGIESVSLYCPQPK